MNKQLLEEMKAGKVRLEFGNPDQIQAIHECVKEEERKAKMCKDCHGQGEREIECPECEGSGEITAECDECGGTGECA